jgi:KDEL-tailed cysteine endopeptidase
MNTPLCGTDLDHGVTAVGYGIEGGREFYLVRNSWGPDWGDKGYIKIGVAPGKGICGIQMESVWPETK